MRLDSLGKPPILQVVPSPKGPKEDLKIQEVKGVAGTPGESLSSTGEEKLGIILEILSKSKRDNSKKKAQGKSLVPRLVIQEYKRVEGRYKEDWQNEGKRQRGERIDIKG